MIREIRVGVAGLLAALVLGLGGPARAEISMDRGQAGLVPAACSGHGQLRFGRCYCDPGWTGAQCDAPEAPLDCGEHGKARNDRCQCDAGWKGRTCATGVSMCAHGKAAGAKCRCESGWSGDACDQPQ
jgi:hypothetical protein